jgi:hypothetical protein
MREKEKCSHRLITDKGMGSFMDIDEFVCFLYELTLYQDEWFLQCKQTG